MRITSKGQLTIPKTVREQAGFMPGSNVDVIFEDGVVTVRKAKKERADSIDKRIASVRGTGNHRFTTEELMALFRGDD
jgi:antitoxin PrlF